MTRSPKVAFSVLNDFDFRFCVVNAYLLFFAYMTEI